MVVTYLGTNWQFVESGRQDWLPARVPGHVHLDLEREGIIANPLLRTYERGCQWVDETDWVYRTTFDWHPKRGNPKRVLHFEGLDTVCSVYLNGDLVACHDNMFLPLEVDVTELLKEGQNEIKVEFYSAARIGRERLERFRAKVGLKHEVSYLFERSFVRKAQYMFGWDWGPRLVSCGIWKAVWLEEFAFRLQDPWIQQGFNPDGSVEVHLSLAMEGETPPGRLVADVSLLGDDLGIIEMTRADDGLFHADVHVRDPKLWGLDSTSEDTLGVAFGLSDSDEWSLVVPTGLRQAELLREPDEFGESYQILLNGSPVWVFGANWIPNHSFPSVVSQLDYDNQLNRAKGVGMNMLRVWGGGLYESDGFYAATRETGTMVWQDFTFACGYYPDDEEAKEALTKEATYQIKRLRNEPSLVLWCGNNENSMLWDNKWGGEDKSPDRFYGDSLYEELLPQLLSKLDPSRSYVPSSPYYKDERFANAKNRYEHNMGNVGDSHYWDVWHGRGDWVHYADSYSRFSSEFGFASAPSLTVWSQTLIGGEKQAFSSAANQHNKTGKPVEEFQRLIELHYPQIKTIEDLTYYSQCNQRDAMRFALEHYRRGRFCSGTLIWQLNDCWPVQSWALVDSAGKEKLAMHELNRVFSPLLTALFVRGDALEIWNSFVNIETELYPAKELEVAIYDLLTGKVVAKESFAEAVRPGLPTEVGTMALAGIDRKAALAVALREGHPVAWKLLLEPKEVQASSWPITASLHDGLLTVASSGPVVDLLVFDPDDPTNCEFWAGLLLAGHEFEGHITKEPYRLTARSLAGSHEVKITRGPIS
ncbi:MAG: hypothetical protein MUC92_10280 [Fimbriimonadaceae bacterium]|jgi:beta-mannosidase|nr:hypothetical protein [Fimbriimonadaceae bacterium]